VCNSVATPKTVQQWFNTSCFAAPPAYTFGNSNVGHVYGPGINNWDFSLAKTSNLSSERAQLRFEANFFNIFQLGALCKPEYNARHRRVRQHHLQPAGAAHYPIRAETHVLLDVVHEL
jgi:hypothetical protein